jgi:dihydrofolate reductase
MKKIIYYVATSLDGFISGPNNDVSNFVGEGNGVEKYLSDLKEFSTVIMGRKTYEFGYQYGLEPGQLAYPHMEHYIFSDSLHLENAHDLLHIEKLNIKRIQEIKERSSTDVYLCGGGQFAGWLLDHGQIDV